MRGVVVLHDHIAVGPAGITVIDAKHDRGRIAVECRGGLFRDRTEHLVVGGRDCTELVDGVIAQADAVRAAPGRWPARGGAGSRGAVLRGRRLAVVR